MENIFERFAAEVDANGETEKEQATADEVGVSDLICAADFAATPPPPRKWLVDSWIPADHVTGLIGPGGSGKSLIAQQLATALAINYFHRLNGEQNDKSSK